MGTKDFYEKQTPSSRVKTAIVSKYFDAWSNIMIHNQNRYSRESKNIAYIDLFAGCGKYKDGTESTPLIILRKAIDNEKLRNRLITIFNEKNKKHYYELRKAIKELPGIDKLKHQPQILNTEIGQDTTEYFEKIDIVPSLLFVDP